ncbi:MAG: hypothetical protein EZS28_016133 [Streblomastix strix]|uniref:Uncharacterized protein n=1 Tax=Streblomastix strix TaxID=222440 RepID=A0A5J4W074_9EUKA|nr:MAG: hypothetical protein EZS28_016133 [Streblomastix strix]
MTDEGTRRPLHSDPIGGLSMSFSMSQGLSFVQLVLRLKTDGLPEDEQIALLQQMIFFASRSDEDLRIALESEGIEIASSLFTKTSNKRIKQLCIGLIGMIGQLGVEDEQKDGWVDLYIPLSKLLFSSDNELQRRGKNSLINLIERNENVVSGLLHIGLLDRAAESLMRIPLSSSQQQSSILPMTSSSLQISSSSPYSVFVMNILEVLDKVLNSENAVFIKSNKLISVLEKIKTERSTKEIRKKAKFIQDSVIEEGQDNETEKQLDQSKEKIISLEDRIRTLEEQIRNKDERERIQQQEKIDSDQQIIRLNQQIEAKENENRQVKSRLASSEEKVQTLEQQSHDKDIRINTLTQEKANIERQIQQIQEQINQNNNRKEILTREMTQSELNVLESKLNIRRLQLEKIQNNKIIEKFQSEKTSIKQRQTTAEGQSRILTTLNTQKDQSINTLTREKTQLEQKITTAEKLKNVDFDKIARNLKKNIEGNEDQKKKIRYKQEENCSLISALIENRIDDDLRQRIINAGISQALIEMFAYRDFDQINDSHMNAYIDITYPYTPLISQLLYEQKPFQSLLRVLDHNDSHIVDTAIGSIVNILYGIVMESNRVCVHPYYTDLAQIGGIEKIYSLFKRNISEFSKSTSAITIGVAFRNREIADYSMKVEIINHLKQTVNHQNEDMRKEAKFALRCLVQNYVNRTEIEKGGFKIPD